MTAPWIAAFVALTTVNLATLIIVLGVLRRVLPALEEAGRHRHSGAVTDFAPGMGSGPPSGGPLPEFEARTDNQQVTSGQLATARAVLLFLDEACEACRTLKAELHRVPPRLAGVQLYLVVDEHTDLASLPTGPGTQALRQHDGVVADALSIDILPSAVAVRDGIVMGWQPMASAQQLQRMIESVMRADEPQAGATPDLHFALPGGAV